MSLEELFQGKEKKNEIALAVPSSKLRRREGGKSGPVERQAGKRNGGQKGLNQSANHRRPLKTPVLLKLPGILGIAKKGVVPTDLEI